MTVPAATDRAELSGAGLDAAREALAPRLRSGDLTALVEYFGISGIRMELLD